MEGKWEVVENTLSAKRDSSSHLNREKQMIRIRRKEGREGKSEEGGRKGSREEREVGEERETETEGEGQKLHLEGLHPFFKVQWKSEVCIL